MTITNAVKKVLIISFRYPPNTETGAARPRGWAKYLYQFGYKPIIVTRNWQFKHPGDSTLLITPSGSEVLHEVYDTHEVYYLPYKGTYRTNLFLKYRNSKYAFFYKCLSFFDQAAESLGFYYFSEYRMFFTWILSFLKKNRDIQLAVITACPFKLFNIGKLIHKKYGVRWVADYRDPWTTEKSYFKEGASLLHRLLHRLEHSAEYRWCSTAAHITSVSDHITHSISRFLGVKGTTIYNGYFERERNLPVQVTDRSVFKIIHNGSLYPIHKIEVFLEGLKKLINFYEGKIAVVFYGIGMEYTPLAAKRVASCMKGYEKNVMLTNRLTEEEYLNMQNGAQLLLIAGAGHEIKGVTSSKIFDYITVEKPVLLVPNDNDVVEHILKQTGQGIFADTPGEVFDVLCPLVEAYRTTGNIHTTYHKEAVGFYSREQQTKKLAELLDSI